MTLLPLHFTGSTGFPVTDSVFCFELFLRSNNQKFPTDNVVFVLLLVLEAQRSEWWRYLPC